MNFVFPIAIMLTERKHFCDSNKQIPFCVDRLNPQFPLKNLSAWQGGKYENTEKPGLSTQCPIFLATIHISNAYVKWKR